jgi:predicted nucleotidyltransferase component of viral defense system
MRSYITQIIDKNSKPADKLNRLREYLQMYFLYTLFKKKFYTNLVFTDGTALRFVHKIRRFSEDLDFSLSDKAQGYDFSFMLNDIKNEFTLAGYDIEVKESPKKTVNSAFLKFPGLLFEVGLSPLKAEKITIKLEVDTRPPAGGIEENKINSSPFFFYMVHYDLRTLFAGKLHALLSREFTKGRDWYDLFWYLATFENLEPNYVFLNNALLQTRKDSLQVAQGELKSLIIKEIERLDIAAVRKDVFLFLENTEEIEMLTRENLMQLVNENKML